MPVIELLKIFFSGVALVIASNFLVRSLVKVSRFARLSEFAISFVLLAFATSLPEVFIGITSAIKGVPELAYSVAIGSNIVDLTFILGVTIIFAKGIPVKGILQKSDGTYMSIVTLLILLLSADGDVSRADGAILLATYGWYMVKLLGHRQYVKNVDHGVSAKEFVLNLIVALASTAILLISATSLVEGAIEFTSTPGISIVLLGFILIAAGTSFPELVFGLVAVKRHHKNLALGDLMGSVVTNGALIIGVSALIQPLHFAEINVVLSSFLYLIIILILFNIFLHTRKELSRWEGLVLVLIYFAYLATEYHLQPQVS